MTERRWPSCRGWRVGRCDRCVTGHEQQCPDALGHAYGISLDGGLADEVWVDPGCAKVLPRHPPPRDMPAWSSPWRWRCTESIVPGCRSGVTGPGRRGGADRALHHRRRRAVGADVDVLARHPARSHAGGATRSGDVDRGPTTTPCSTPPAPRVQSTKPSSGCAPVAPSASSPVSGSR